MAEESAIAAQPVLAPDFEVQRFAEGLFGYLWVRFKVVRAEAGQAQHRYERPIFTETIGRAVLCEQLLMRRIVLREIFHSWSLIIFRDPDSVYLFCQALIQNCISNWSYYKRFFRCCAVISEFYLFRRNLTDDNQLNRAERVFKIVFDDFFGTNWAARGGWQGLEKFARERINPIYPRFETYLNNIIDPLDSNPPCIESFPISYEVDTRFVSHQARTYDIHSELAAAFKKMSTIFFASKSEETINLFKNISLKDKPTERSCENVDEGSSTTQVKDEVTGIEPIQLPRFVSTVPLPDDSSFLPIEEDVPSSNLSHRIGSTPIYKPKPQKSSPDSPMKKIRDRRSAVDSQSLNRPSEGSMRMDVSDANPAFTEDRPQNPTRKRTMSTGSSDENEGSKKPKK